MFVFFLLLTMSQQKIEYYKTETGGLFYDVLNATTKLHRARESLSFIEKCQRNSLLPNFTKLSPKVISQTQLTPNQVKGIRLKKLNQAMDFQVNRIDFNQKRIDCTLKTISTHFLSLRETRKLKTDVKYLVLKNEQKNDERRVRVFRKLLGVKKQEEARIEIFNFTDTTIPFEVQQALENGIDRAVGGQPDEYGLLTSFECLYRHWSAYAEKLEISPLDIWKTGNKISVDFDRLTRCYSEMSR